MFYLVNKCAYRPLLLNKCAHFSTWHLLAPPACHVAHKPVCLAAHANEARNIMRHATLINASCHTHEWVMSHTWMNHVTHMDETWHTRGWVKSHTQTIKERGKAGAKRGVAKPPPRPHAQQSYTPCQHRTEEDIGRDVSRGLLHALTASSGVPPRPRWAERWQEAEVYASNYVRLPRGPPNWRHRKHFVGVQAGRGGVRRRGVSNRKWWEKGVLGASAGSWQHVAACCVWCSVLQ